MDMKCSYQIGDTVYEGTTPKFRLNIDTGVPMSEIDFEVELIGTDNTLIIKKSEMPQKDDGYYLCFDTKDLGVGIVKAVIYAYITDHDFKNKVRKEVDVIKKLLVVNAV